jgi:hypothetical protein
MPAGGLYLPRGDPGLLKSGLPNDNPTIDWLVDVFKIDQRALKFPACKRRPVQDASPSPPTHLAGRDFFVR